MKLRYFIGAVILGLGLALSCEREAPLTLSEIQVSESYVPISVKGGSTELKFTATGSWQIDETTLPEWLTAAPTSGMAGDVTVVFSAGETTSTRTAEVKIKCGSATQYINVLQYAKKADPVVMSVSEALALIKTVDPGDGQSHNVDGEYCVKGTVCKIDEISTSYGNATYYLSENGKFESGKWLEVYRGYWLNNTKFTKGDEFAVGDELTIIGQLMSYKGTPETVQNTAYVVAVKKSLISVEDFDFEKLPACDTTFSMMVTAKESPLLVTSDAQWLQITGVNSNGSYELHADANAYTAERTANISIQGPTALKTVSVTQSGVPASGASVSEIIATADNSQVQTLPSTVVVALTTRGAVLSDGQKSIYAYGSDAAALKVGDAVSMKAKKVTYNGVPELTDLSDIFVDSQGNPFVYPDVVDVTPDAATYTASEAEYIGLSGTLKVSGNYYNILLDAFEDGSKQGSIVYPVDELNAKNYDGQKITVVGWFNGLSSAGKFINIIATKITPYEANPKGTATNPYGASELATLIMGGATFDSNVYVKGKVSAILYSFSADYGTGTFWISDDGVAHGVAENKKSTTAPTEDFECYGVYWFENKPWAEGNGQPAVGDEVVICGQVTCYNNATAETQNKKAWVYSWTPAN